MQSISTDITKLEEAKRQKIAPDSLSTLKDEDMLTYEDKSGRVISRGVTVKDTVVLEDEQTKARVVLDAQGRTFFVIISTRRKEGTGEAISTQNELSDKELVGMWRLCIRASRLTGPSQNDVKKMAANEDKVNGTHEESSKQDDSDEQAMKDGELVGQEDEKSPNVDVDENGINKDDKQDKADKQVLKDGNQVVEHKDSKANGISNGTDEDNTQYMSDKQLAKDGAEVAGKDYGKSSKVNGNESVVNGHATKESPANGRATSEKQESKAAPDDLKSQVQEENDDETKDLFVDIRINAGSYQNIRSIHYKVLMNNEKFREQWLHCPVFRRLQRKPE